MLKQDVSVLKQDVSELKQDMIEVKGDIRVIKRDIVKLQSGQENLLRRSDRLDAWMRATVGRMGSDKGTQLEDVFAAELRFGLNNPGLSENDLRLRVKVVDQDGLIYPRGFITEVDVVSSNGQLIVFEIKASAEIDDVDIFAMKIRLFKLQQPKKDVRGVIFSMGINDELKERCQYYGVELIQPLSTST